MESRRASELVDAIGRAVQEGWAEEAKKLPNPPPAWLKTYDEVSESMRRKDRNIGRHVIKALWEWANDNHMNVKDFAMTLKEVAESGEEKL